MGVPIGMTYARLRDSTRHVSPAEWVFILTLFILGVLIFFINVTLVAENVSE